MTPPSVGANRLYTTTNSLPESAAIAGNPRLSPTPQIRIDSGNWRLSHCLPCRRPRVRVPSAASKSPANHGVLLVHGLVPFAQPSLTKKKMRRLKLQAGAPKFQGGRSVWSTNEAMRKAKRELACRRGRAYERTVSDWQAKRPAKAGAGATNGRASSGSSKDQVARQT
jgi:hypothetical protein